MAKPVESELVMRLRRRASRDRPEISLADAVDQTKVDYGAAELLFQRTLSTMMWEVHHRHYHACVLRVDASPDRWSAEACELNRRLKVLGIQTTTYGKVLPLLVVHWCDQAVAGSPGDDCGLQEEYYALLGHVD